MADETVSEALRVIASPPPRVPTAAAAALAREHYGLEATARPLVSERDANFRLDTATGERYVLKIANADEDPQVTDFQLRALAHVAAGPGPGLALPQVQPTTAGRDRVALDLDGREHCLRVVSWVPGRPMSSQAPDAGLARNAGRALASLGRALAGFDHPGGAQPLLWDLREAPGLAGLLPAVEDVALRGLLERCLDDLGSRALPRTRELRSQVIHNDMNPANVMLRDDEPSRVSGIIDFGDMQRAPLVFDPAVACAYLRNAAGDPLEFIAAFVAGYHETRPLEGAELDLLYDLISARLATTVILLAWRSAERGPGDAYRDAAAAQEGDAAEFLGRFRQLPRDDVARRLRQVAASAGTQPEL